MLSVCLAACLSPVKGDFHTLLRQSLPLVLLESFFSTLALHDDIRLALSKLDHQFASKQLLALQKLHRIFGIVDRAKDDKCLTAGSEILFRNDFVNFAQLRADVFDAFDQGRDFDRLVNVAQIEAGMGREVSGARGSCAVRTRCNVRTLRWVGWTPCWK